MIVTGCIILVVGALLVGISVALLASETQALIHHIPHHRINPPTDETQSPLIFLGWYLFVRGPFIRKYF